MAFVQSKSTDGSSDPYEYYQVTSAEAITIGEALVQTSGLLTKCAATATPEFIAVASAAAATPGAIIPVIRTKDDREFEVLSTATVASTLIGAKVTIDSTGLLVTATTTNGVFEISATDGATTTSRTRGYFRR